MEHRWYRRVHTPVDVIIHINDCEKQKFQIDNISMGGIFVAKKSHGQIVSKNDIKNTIVKVEFNESPFSVTLPAMVLRNSEKYAALMFTTYHPDLRPFLQKLRSQEEITARTGIRKKIEAKEIPFASVERLRKISTR